MAWRARRPLRRAKAYGPGVTDSEIKLGTTSPYSGPASAYGVYGHGQTAYFQMINEQGGINGRKINLISLDNGYNPPKALEQTRKLVEEDNVLAIAGFLGTAPNTSVQKYLNGRKVPNLFLTSGADRFNDPKNYPWIVPLYPTYVGQGEIYAKFILTTHPGAKIGVLYINDDLGKDFLLGLKKGLGDRARTMIVREVSNELTDPSVDSQIIDLKGRAPTRWSSSRPRSSPPKGSARPTISGGGRGSISWPASPRRSAPRSFRPGLNAPRA